MSIYNGLKGMVVKWNCNTKTFLGILLCLPIYSPLTTLKTSNADTTSDY